ncbi:MAG: ATP-binding cassette domain-containing protein, partial [Oscillospiraceae bacterium]|nr:ATP-binding cassette domain-containing protein [Oscillospiraceae bacterium]
MDAVLRVRELTKSFKGHQVLRGVSMEIPKGSIYGLVGRNGAGKTTLIRLICGLQKPDGGEYDLFGEKNESQAIVEVRRRTGAVVEVPSLYQELSAEDNLKAQYKLLGRKDLETVPELLRQVDLEGTGKKKVKDFSLGMKQRLGIAIALAGEPEFLILDEP